MTKKDILSDIVAAKRTEVARQKQAVPSEILRQQVEELLRKNPATRSLRRSLAASPTGIIAEFKRRSPSKGWINPEADPRKVVQAYEQNGASALSILTDEPYFGGTLADLQAARPLTSLPILRKDFIIDPYQLLQARLAGADAVLLIAACLTRTECDALADEAHSLGLEVLLEIHADEELDYVSPRADLAGINNRHLGSFHTDVQNSFRLAEQLAGKAAAAGHPLLVSESGISRPDTLRRLREAGFRGFLIGETFMKTPSPGQTLHTFIRQIQEKHEENPRET